MNVLSLEKQVKVVSMLTEGCSQRTIERLTGIKRETIGRLLLRVGSGCAALHNERIKSLAVNRIEVDEIHAIIGKRDKKLKDSDPIWMGAQYTHIAVAEASRLIITYCIGKRTSDVTADFIEDVRARVLGKPEISSDGYAPYVSAIRRSFGDDADYGQVLKVEQFYTPKFKRQCLPRAIGGKPVKTVVKTGNPRYISTNIVERQNLTLRTSCARFRRAGLSFSKDIRSHSASVALYAAHYNFCKWHEHLKTTPAVAQGLEEAPWSMEQLVAKALALANEETLNFQETNMARIRTIKPDFFRHELLFEAERECDLPLRLSFAGLWTAADRDGRFVWSPRALKLDCLPYDDVDFSRVLDALTTRGFIQKYVVDGREFGFIPSWSKHQVINNREKASDLPEPNENNILTRAPRVTDACATPLCNYTGEGKGREGNIDAAPNGAHLGTEIELFERGKTVLGKTAGGLITNLLKAKNGSIPLARAAVEQASTKQDPREYIGRVIAGPNGAVTPSGNPWPEGIT